MTKRARRFGWRRLWRYRRQLAIAAGAPLFLVLWALVPLLYRHGGSADARLKAVTDTRTAMLAGLVGVGAIGTFWLNSRVYRITARTFEVTEQGHITDRYAKAIEHLGSEAIDVRLGGIYALERIAHDSQRDQDQATIVEVLSAFVRVHSDPVYRLRKDRPELRPENWEQERQLAAEQVAAERLPVDVHAAVTVLGRLPLRAGISRADLWRADLARASLTGADLSGAKLQGANLSGAQLSEADLSGALLNGTNLSYARLTGADLSGARLIAADLSHAWLDGADLAGADFGRAEIPMPKVRMYGARMASVRGLRQEQVDQAYGDARTLLPRDLRHPAHWTREDADEGTADD
jgi:hypothetical protein